MLAERGFRPGELGSWTGLSGHTTWGTGGRTMAGIGPFRPPRKVAQIGHMTRPGARAVW
jgi:hypothetical protein